MMPGDQYIPAPGEAEHEQQVQLIGDAIEVIGWLEWVDFDDGTHRKYCPICARQMEEGHPGCKVKLTFEALKAELKRLLSGGSPR